MNKNPTIKDEKEEPMYKYYYGRFIRIGTITSESVKSEKK